MPVWHEKTRALRAAGKLAVVGIAQEQHPDRCRLFAQWHDIDWPILWDPFNRTGSKVVPRFTLIDEHGVVRSTRPSGETLEAFLATAYEKPAGDDPAPSGARDRLIAQPARGTGPTYATLSKLLWRKPTDAFPVLGPLEAPGNLKSPAHAFWLGVAYLMRHEDPKARQKGDFRRAAKSWLRAQRGDPAQYIWRRRIQQFGPRMDKPYPFYDWVPKAMDAIRARGQEPVVLRVALTQSEQAGRTAPPTPDTAHPDPDDKVPWFSPVLSCEVLRVPSTKKGAKDAQVHVLVYPPENAKWDLDAALPILWTGQRALRPHPRPDAHGAWRFEFADMHLNHKWNANVFVFVPVCLDSGECTLLKSPVTINTAFR